MGSWRNSRTSSTKLLWVILPFMAVAVFIGVKKSNLVDRSKYNSFVWSSVSGYSSSVIKDDVAEGPVALGRRKTVVEGGGGGGADVAEAPVEGGLFDRSFNSSYPPLGMEDEMDVELPVVAKEDDSNVTLSGPDIFVSFNQTTVLPVGGEINRKYTSLDKLEARLGRVRAAIKEAESSNRTHDPDYIPEGPMYWNGASFHRSYLEMEKLFKVFVYEEGEPPIFHDGPCKSIYSMEGNFIYHMETTKFRTRNPEKAHTFFLPMSTTMMVRFIFERDPHVDHWLPMKQTVKDYVDLVGSKYPFWNRSLGADHFTVACHDWGPELSKAVPYLFKNSIRALCNANTSEGFNPSINASTETTLISGCDHCVFSPSARSYPQQNINGVAVLPFGEGTSGPKPVDDKNNDETISAALEADENQNSEEFPGRVRVSQELTKLCTIDTTAGKKESNGLKYNENAKKTSIVNETISQPFESDQPIDNSQNGQPKRKARKVRLLKELLCKNTEIKQQKKDNSSSSAPFQVKRKILHDHDDQQQNHDNDNDNDNDHHHDPKKAKPFKGDAIAKNNVVEQSRNSEGPEFGENINKYEWNKHGTQRSSVHGKVGSDPMTAWQSIFSEMGRPDNRVPPTYSVPKSRGTDPYPNFMNPLKSDKKAYSSKKISSNPIKSNFFVEDSRRVKDDSRADAGLGLDLSLNYDPQSHVRSQLPILNRPPNQDYCRKSDFFLGESSNFPHRIQPDSIRSKERSVHEKQLYAQLPYGSCSGHQKLDFSDPYKRNTGVGGYSEFSRPNNHQRQDNVFSIGRSDEREVIELMAKNQYERNLCEANNGIISGFRKPMNEGMTSSHRDYLSMIRPPSSSIAMGENMGPMRNPAGGFFHQDRLSSFTMSQKKPLNGVWMSDSGPQRHYDSRYHYASNGNNKRPPTHLYNPSNMQVLEAFNKYNNGTHQHEAANMQFGQTYAKYSDKDKGKSMMDLDLNVMASNVVEEQNNFESLDVNPNRMCSFDSSYSNEAIPAMQLLSLMDAGKLSQPFSLTGQTCVTKPKPKPNSSCFSHCSSTVTEKTNSMVNPIGSSQSSVFRTSQNVKFPTSGHGQQVYHKQQELKSRGTSLTFVGRRPEDSYVFPPWQTNEGQNRVVNRAFGPRSDPPRTEICTINRNPADFSTPGPENVYMINVEDLVVNWERCYGSNSQKKPAS